MTLSSYLTYSVVRKLARRTLEEFSQALTSLDLDLSPFLIKWESARKLIRWSSNQLRICTLVYSGTHQRIIIEYCSSCHYSWSNENPHVSFWSKPTHQYLYHYHCRHPWSMNILKWLSAENSHFSALSWWTRPKDVPSVCISRYVPHIYNARQRMIGYARSSGGCKNRTTPRDLFIRADMIYWPGYYS